MSKLRIYLVTDHAGFDLKEKVKQYLITDGVDVTDLSPELIQGDDYPDAAKNLADYLKSDTVLGIAFCGTGQGICIALNRFNWIRACGSQNVEIVKLSRQHNHANVLCLPGRFLDLNDAKDLVSVFLNTIEDNNERHLRRLSKLNEL